MASRVHFEGAGATLPADNITGNGTINKVAKFTGANAIGDSIITANGTNVGIGTTSPTSKLQVSGTISSITNVENGTAQISILNSNTAPSAEQFYVGNNLGDVDLGNKRGALKLFTGVSERMRITNTGNVGIGTSSPTAQLQVNGTGATAATTALLVQNSSGTELLKTFDNGFTTLGGASAYNNYLLDLKGANTTLRLQSGQNFSNAYCGIGFTNSSNGSSLSSEIRAYRQASFNELRFVFGATHALAVHSTGQIGIGTVTPDASAILDITSTTQGLLPPRMTSAELAAIAAPAVGLQVYDTTTNNLNYFNGTVWVVL